MSKTQINGAGIGLRSKHYQHILSSEPDVPWFEILTENYMGDGGLPLYYLEKIRQLYPLTFHGVGMSLGSVDPLDMKYMNKLKHLVKRFQPAHISDHLSWVSFSGKYLHELLPFSYNQQNLQHIASKIDAAQDFLGMPIAVENPSSYMCLKYSDMSEWDFINLLCQTTGCKLLLDVNNIYVSACNTDFNQDEYINNIDIHHIIEIHLAGFEDRGTHLYDTHGSRVNCRVWELFQQLINRSGPIPSLLEWDTDIPDFSVLQAESEKAQHILDASINLSQQLQASAI